MRLGRKLAAGTVVEPLHEPIPESADAVDQVRETGPTEVRVEDAPREQHVELIEQSAGR